MYQLYYLAKLKKTFVRIKKNLMKQSLVFFYYAHLWVIGQSWKKQPGASPNTMPGSWVDTSFIIFEMQARVVMVCLCKQEAEMPGGDILAL